MNLSLDSDIDYKKIYDQFDVTVQHFGESTDNLLKITALMQHYPDISLFVQTNPAFLLRRPGHRSHGLAH